jgi:predicted alpha/beta-fold hydrolase
MVVVEAALAGPALAIGAVGLAALLAWLDALNKSQKPELIYNATPFNTAVMSRCPTLHSVYQCTPFLTNGHVETIVVAKARKAPGVDYRREILVTKDGGAVAIDWEHHDDAGKVRAWAARHSGISLGQHHGPVKQQQQHDESGMLHKAYM